MASVSRRWAASAARPAAAGLPGGDPCRPADQRLALRAAADRDYHALPDVTAAQILAAGPVRQGAARERGGFPPEGKLAQRRQDSSVECPAQRALGLLCRVDAAAGHPVSQCLRRTSTSSTSSAAATTRSGT